MVGNFVFAVASVLELRLHWHSSRLTDGDSGVSIEDDRQITVVKLPKPVLTSRNPVAVRMPTEDSSELHDFQSSPVPLPWTDENPLTVDEVGHGDGESAARPGLSRAWTKSAWVVILIAAGTVFALNFLTSRSTGGKGGEELAADMQARIALGVSQFPGTAAEMHRSLRDGLEPGNYSGILRTTVVTAEIVGLERAVEELDELAGDWLSTETPPTPDEVRLATVLRELYELRRGDDFAEKGLPADSTEFLESTLGWTGRLAVNPVNGPQPEAREALMAEANRTAVVFFCAAVAGVLSVVVGLALLVIWGVLAFLGTVQFHLRVGSGTGGFYAETFALWFVTFFFLNILVAPFCPAAYRMLCVGLMSALSLLTLLWPVGRGVPWSQVREEVGLTWPKHPVREIATGVVSYIAGAPLLAIGMVCTVFLMQLQKAMQSPALLAFADTPMHPIIQPLARGTTLDRIQAVAVVLLVPITEEIMFRGVLYRHLREASLRWGAVISVLFSILFNAFLFAAIHPQGILGIPLLMSIAIVLAVSREWRGSLVAPTVTHMIVNGMTTTIVLLAFG